MRKSDYKNALNVIHRARKYGTKLFSHPLAPDPDTVELARMQIKNMNSFVGIDEPPFYKPKRAPIKRRIYSPKGHH